MSDKLFSPFPVLQTERLILRKLGLTDSYQVLRLRSDEKVCKFMERKTAKTIFDAYKYISIINRGIGINNWVLWGISQKQNDKLIGIICLWNMDFDTKSAEIGYELLPEYWSMGYMSECLSCIINYAFEKLNMQTINAITHNQNQKSILLLLKHGFYHVDSTKRETKSCESSFELKNNRHISVY